MFSIPILTILLCIVVIAALISTRTRRVIRPEAEYYQWAPGQGLPFQALGITQFEVLCLRIVEERRLQIVSHGRPTPRGDRSRRRQYRSAHWRHLHHPGGLGEGGRGGGRIAGPGFGLSSQGRSSREGYPHHNGLFFRGRPAASGGTADRTDQRATAPCAGRAARGWIIGVEIESPVMTEGETALSTAVTNGFDPDRRLGQPSNSPAWGRQWARAPGLLRPSGRCAGRAPCPPPRAGLPHLLAAARERV